MKSESVTVAEFDEEVKKLFSGQVQRVDEILSEMLKALNVAQLFWLTCVVVHPI